MQFVSCPYIFKIIQPHTLYVTVNLYCRHQCIGTHRKILGSQIINHSPTSYQWQYPQSKAHVLHTTHISNTYISERYPQRKPQPKLTDSHRIAHSLRQLTTTPLTGKMLHWRRIAHHHHYHRQQQQQHGSHQ